MNKLNIVEYIYQFLPNGGISGFNSVEYIYQFLPNGGISGVGRDWRFDFWHFYFFLCHDTEGLSVLVIICVY